MYESHVTVDGIDRTKFVGICKEFGLKPVLIEDDTGSDHPRQMMTAKFHKTKSRMVAITEMKTIARHFGPRVVRRKLELILGKEEPPADRLYLEFHTKYLLPVSGSSAFEAAVRRLGGHISRNAWKSPDEIGMCYRFMTTRDRRLHREIIADLPRNYRRLNTIAECVVFDDNPTLDSRWHCFDCPIKKGITW